MYRIRILEYWDRIRKEQGRILESVRAHSTGKYPCTQCWKASTYIVLKSIHYTVLESIRAHSAGKYPCTQCWKVSVHTMLESVEARSGMLTVCSADKNRGTDSQALGSSEGTHNTMRAHKGE